jgi:hypothetical protein
MPKTFQFTSPEGKSYEITGPDDATQDQAFGILQKQIGAPPPPITNEQRNFAPEVPKPGLPEDKPEFQGMDYGSELPIPSSNFATQGAGRMAAGAAKMTRPGISPKLGGASEIFRGAAQIASPVAAGALPAAAFAAPVATALGMAGGLAGGKAARSGAAALGGNEDVQNFAEDVGSAAGGFAGVRSSRPVSATMDRARQRISDVRNGIVADPKLTLTQALKPRSTALGFNKSLDHALPDLKAAETVRGPIENVDSLLDAVNIAKKTNRQQWKQFTGPSSQMGTQVDLTPVADSIVASASETMKLENPAQYQALIESSNRYRGKFPIEKVENLLRDTNAELDSYYAKYPTAQRSALRANPETAALAAKADELRSSLYNALDDPGLGEGPRTLNRRYGALLDVEEEAQRRKNVAMRQQPENLTQQLSKVQAYGKTALGAGKLAAGALSGSGRLAASGAGDVLEATALRRGSDWMKEQQTTDALIRRAFKSYKGGPNPEMTLPPAPVIRGLLGPAPLVTPPPPDSSYVRGAPAMPAPPPHQKALPPASTIFAPAAADRSSVRGVPAHTPFRTGFSQKALPPATTMPRGKRALGSQRGDILNDPFDLRQYLDGGQ